MQVSMSFEDALYTHTRFPRAFWPEKFDGLIAWMEDKAVVPPEAWLLLGDWCQENDEPGLERACRYLGETPGVRVRRPHNTAGVPFIWSLEFAAASLLSFPGRPPGRPGSFFRTRYSCRVIRTLGQLLATFSLVFRLSEGPDDLHPLHFLGMWDLHRNRQKTSVCIKATKPSGLAILPYRP